MLAAKFIPVQDDPAHEKFLVRGRLDVLAVLRAMAAFRVSASVRFSHRPETAPSRVLSLKPEYNELVFDGSEVAGLDSLDGRVQVTADASYDYIHVRFSGEHVECAVFRGAPAFRCAIPGVVARRQRRHSVRFPVPAFNPPVVRAVLDPDAANQPALRLIDISLGGVSMALEDDAIEMAPGTMLRDCRLELPRRGSVITDIEVVYVDALVGDGEGALRGRRLGCRFVGTSVLALEHLRSYINLLERDRLAALTY